MSNTKRTRTIDSFFMSSSGLTTKKLRTSANPGIREEGCDEVGLKKDDDNTDNLPASYSSHPTYPFPIPHLPSSISHALRPSTATPSSSPGRPITDTDLDLLYFEPFIPRPASRQLFEFLRASLPFYRVEYDITRSSSSSSQKQRIRTPRWTTVFGLDDTAHFVPSSAAGTGIRDSSVLVPNCRPGSYRATPRPMPQCLEDLRVAVERALAAASGREEDKELKEEETDDSSRMFNFCLVNYYASGADSISFHSDDERFLGPHPTIASLSLGATRDFLMKRKPAASGAAQAPAAAETITTKPLKLPLATGDMVVMRGTTQANWLHSVPKRSGRNERDGGRINITFRRARVKAGTENYYNYNVGAGPVYRWDASDQEMKQWSKKP
ncbi:hypothetical protein F4775DRAFT_74244 [Biscogniauxia sp. FL1348]|nr:hypothetical protein F4775DRAFT_74244 [Biscogniauxia sp. FL1348]